MILGRPAPPGHIVLFHGDAEKAETLVRRLRSAGHRVTALEPGKRAVQNAIERSPDLLIGSLSFMDPPLPAVIRSVRLALGTEVPVLLLQGAGDQHDDTLVEADDILRETLQCFEHGAIEEGALIAFNIALEQFHNAVADRRTVLMSLPQHLQRTAQLRATGTL